MFLSSLGLAAVLLTSCGGDPDDGTATQEADGPSGTEQSSTPRTPSPSSGSSGADRPRQEQSGRVDLVLDEVTVIAHRGRDRVVLRFAGTGRPGWAARFVEEAVIDGSGKVVELEGDAILQLDVSGTPTTPGRDTPVRSELGGAVVDLHAVGAHEGVTQVFIGLRDDRLPFRVGARTDPSRLVVDLG